VTHRGVASSFTVVTGHKASESGEPLIAWDKLSTGTDTLVILMGIGNLAYVVDQLIKNNKPSSTPVAVITHGTTGHQRCVTGTLQDILSKVKSETFTPFRCSRGRCGSTSQILTFGLISETGNRLCEEMKEESLNLPSIIPSC